jgi:hypothetical protein
MTIPSVSYAVPRRFPRPQGGAARTDTLKGRFEEALRFEEVLIRRPTEGEATMDEVPVLSDGKAAWMHDRRDFNETWPTACTPKDINVEMRHVGIEQVL